MGPHFKIRRARRGGQLRRACVTRPALEALEVRSVRSTILSSRLDLVGDLSSGEIPGLSDDIPIMVTGQTDPSTDLDKNRVADTRPRAELVFIDPRVENYQQIVNGIAEGAGPDRRIETFVLRADQGGIGQITEALAGRVGLDAIHLISHGSAGGVLVGDSWWDSSTLNHYVDSLIDWRGALSPDADILVYGCDVAQTPEGRAFLESLSATTGADVSASTDLTGHSARGGNWNLEFATGPIETSVALDPITQARWEGSLATFAVTNTNNSGAGSLRQAITDANNLGGFDTITFNIAGTGPHSINLTSALPTITGAVFIDGWSEPDYAGSPVIELNGSGAGAGANGLDISGGGTTVRGLAINRFGANGVRITGGGGNVLVGNYIGTSVNGSSDRGNSQDGVLIDNSSNNVVGGTTAATRNVLSGNDVHGVRVVGSAATNNTIQGNYIGLNATGAGAIGNTQNGIWIANDSRDNLIGGTVLGAGNVVSGNIDTGVEIQDDGTSGNRIEGNLIGLNAAGTAAIGNRDGVIIEDAQNNTVGGPTAAHRNVISGNTFSSQGNGVVIFGTKATGNLVQSNFLGTDITGVLDRGNTGSGVLISDRGDGGVIKGPATGNTIRENVISGNDYAGVAITSSGVNNNGIIGNLIGVNASGLAALGNSVFGVVIWNGANGNKVGGVNPGDGNVIAFNDRGVVVDANPTASLNNSLLGNRIYGNTQLGIDLNNDGITLNDSGDGDAGPNGLQNFPVLTTVTSSGGATTIAGSLNSQGSTSYRIEFFSSPTRDETGYGEGKTSLGFVNVTTDPGGNATFNKSLVGVTLTTGQVVSATATVDLGGGNYGGTSEFARNYLANTTQFPSSQDTYINISKPSFNYGISPILVVDRSGGGYGNQHALLKFDLSSIPANAIITSATLLMEAGQNGGAFNNNVYEVTQGWVEGTRDGSADIANWNQRLAGTNWTTAGGTINPTAVATLNTALTGQHAWNVTTLAQAWISGVKANNGLLLGSLDTGTTSITYDSKEGAIPPVLAIDYVLPVNVGPTVTLPGGPAGYRLGDPLSILDATATVTVIDSPDFNNGVLTVSILSNASLDDRLEIQDGGAIRLNGNVIETRSGGPNVPFGTFTGGTDGFTPLVITLNANATRARTQDLLRAIGYRNVSSTAISQGKNAQFVLSDGDGGVSAPRSIAINITGANQAPVNVVPGPQMTDLNTPLTFSTANGNPVSTNDPDAAANPIQVTLTATNGTLTLKFGGGLADPVGNEFLVNATTTNSQAEPAVARSPSGNTVVVWSGYRNAPNPAEIFCQVYDANGNPIGSQSTVNATSANVQSQPAVAMDQSGNFVVVWTSVGQDNIDGKAGVYGQRFDATGAPVGGEFLVNTVTVNDQSSPAIAMNGQGVFVVVWTDKILDGSAEGVYGQRFDAAGNKLGGQFRVNTTTSQSQKNPDVAMDAAGNFVVVWDSVGQDWNDGAAGVYSRRYDASGVPLGGEVLVNTTVFLDQDHPSIAMNAAGAYVISWTSMSPLLTGLGVFVQTYDASGNRTVPTETLVNTTIFNDQMSSRVAMDANGNFAVVWESVNQDSPGDNLKGVYVQQFEKAGARLGSERLVNTTVTGAQDSPDVGMDADGDMVIVWHGNGSGDTNGVFFRRYQNATELSFSVGDGVADATMTFSGSLTDVKAALDGMTFTPNLNFVGPGTVTLSVNDLGNSGTGGAKSDTDLINVTVGGNSPPTITSDGGGATASVNVAENSSAVTTVIASDPNAPPQVLAFSIVGGSDRAKFTLDAGTGVLTFLIAPDFEAPTDLDLNNVYEVTVQVSDGAGGVATQDFRVTVTNLNETPVAVNDFQVVNEDFTLNVSAPGVLGNVLDPDGQPLTALLVSGTTNGVLVLNPNGSFYYAPNANFHGIDSFVYKVSDGTLTSNHATVTITVNSVNDVPVAADDGYATSVNSPLFIPVAGVLANDTDVDGDPLFASIVSLPSNGILVLNPDGSFLYTPFFMFYGIDTFMYQATDLIGNSNVATVTIDVSSMNTPPNAGPDGYSVDEDATLILAAPGVLANDSDPNSDPLTAVLVSGPSNGSLIFNADGSFSYTPNPNFNGTDSFTYRANDGALTSGLATVTIVVNPVNDAPVASDDGDSVDENATLNIAAAGVLGNDLDVDGDSLSVVLVGGPTNGSLVLNSDGSFRYTPNTNFHGTDSFTYQAHDGALFSNIATVTISVNPVGYAPVANDDDYSVNEDATLTIPAAGVLGNDFDVHGDPLTAVLVTSPVHGSLTFQSDGSFSYTPNPNFNGTDSFRYKATNGSIDSSVVTVMIFVDPVNDAPVAIDDVYSIDEDGTLTVPMAGVMSNDSDIDDDPLLAVLMTGPSNGSLIFNSDGSFTYTPFANFHGMDSFQYRVDDGLAQSGLATVTITVDPINDAPERIGGPLNDLTVLENSGSTSLGLGGLDYRPGPGVTEASQNLTYTITAVPSASLGRIVLADDATVVTVGASYSLTELQGMRFQPGPNAFGGPETFAFQVHDDGGVNNGGFDTLDQSMAISVTQVNAPPSHAVPGPQSFDQYTTLAFSQATANAITVTDTDAGLDPIRVTLSVTRGSVTLTTTSGLTIVAGSNGGPSITIEGTVPDINAALDGLVYTPSPFFSGSDDLTIETDDLGHSGVGGPLTASSAVAITVNYVPTAPVVLVSASQNSSIYGQSLTFTATVTPVTGTPTGTVTFLDGSTVLGTTVLNGGVATFTTSSLSAGNHDITALYSGDMLFLSNLSPVLSQTVNQAPLTIQANGATSIYGDPLPALSVSYAGWMNGDTPSSLGGVLSIATTAAPGGPAGAYAISPSGLTSSNYAIQYVDGTLTVALATPIALGTTISATEIVPFSGVVATFARLDPSPAPGDYSAEITWGDGRTSTGVVRHDLVGGNYVVEGTYTYGAPGRYAIHVSVLGVNTIPVGVTGEAVVADAPLTISAINISTTEAERFRGLVATFQDAGVPGRPADYEASIEWGNGETSLGLIRFDVLKNAFTVEGTMVYRAEGAFPVRVVVRARSGVEAVATGFAVVADAPLIGFNSVIAVESRNPFDGVVASFIDTGTPDRPEHYSATIDWGDGTSTPGSIHQSETGAFVVVGTHAYEAFGRHVLTVTITGAGGNQAMVTSEVRIETEPVSSSPTVLSPRAVEPTVLLINPPPPLTVTSPPGRGTTTSPPLSPAAESLAVRGAVPVSPPVGQSFSPESPVAEPNSDSDENAPEGEATSPAEGSGAPSPTADSGAGANAGGLSTSMDLLAQQFSAMLKTLTSWGDGSLAIRMGLDSSAIPPALASLAPAALFQAKLDEIVLKLGSEDLPQPFVVMVGTGVVASAGYVFLQSRACYLLLSLMTAKPLWNQYDPLAILDDWEEDENRRKRKPVGDDLREEQDRGETLQSMIHELQDE